jgi:hypothetical protein
VATEGQKIKEGGNSYIEKGAVDQVTIPRMNPRRAKALPDLKISIDTPIFLRSLMER